jgi:hypothetical protein
LEDKFSKGRGTAGRAETAAEEKKRWRHMSFSLMLGVLMGLVEVVQAQEVWTDATCTASFGTRLGIACNWEDVSKTSCSCGQYDLFF